MDIRAALVEEHSKAQAIRIRDYIGDNQERFDVLLDLFLNDNTRITQRSAYTLGMSAELYPQLIEPHLETLVKNLTNENLHVAVKRNTLRILQDIDLSEDLMGIAADVCFDYLGNPKEAVAVRVFSMTVLYNICVKEPDLAGELRYLIEEFLPHGSAGFKSRGRKVLKDLTKL